MSSAEFAIAVVDFVVGSGMLSIEKRRSYLEMFSKLWAAL